MKEESLLLLSDLQKLINQVVLIDYTIIILGGGDIYDCETEYARSRMEQKLGVITVEEFLEKILVN